LLLPGLLLFHWSTNVFIFSSNLAVNNMSGSPYSLKISVLPQNDLSHRKNRFTVPLILAEKYVWQKVMCTRLNSIPLCERGQKFDRQKYDLDIFKLGSLPFSPPPPPSMHIV
jgi:hypothetical protein